MSKKWGADHAQVEEAGSIAFNDDGVDVIATTVAGALNEIGADIQSLTSTRLGFCYAELGAASPEVANERTVVVSLKDWDGAAFAQQMSCRAAVYRSDGQLAANAAFTVAETGVGAAVSSPGASHIFTTSAGGLATLTVTDVAGSTGATVYLIVDVLNGSGPDGRSQYLAIAFDGS